MYAWATRAFNKGGVTVVRRPANACAMAAFTSATVAVGNSDQIRAMAPLTNGVATLVPPSVIG